MFVRILALLGALLLGGCSFQSTINAIASEERQQEVIATAQAICANPQSMRDRFAPELWAQLEPQLPQLSASCPATDAVYQITGVSIDTESTTSAPSQRREDISVVAGSEAGPWTVFEFVFRQAGNGPMLITTMNTEKTATMPGYLADVQAWNDSVNTVRIVGAIILALIVGGIWLLVRRSRRRKAARLAAAANSPPTI
ncbi:MAG: hypothetical protein ABL909_01565 [Sphingopyxis sp.]